MAAGLQRALSASEALTKPAHKQARRDVSTVGKKAWQAVRSHNKASKRKAIAGRE